MRWDEAWNDKQSEEPWNEWTTRAGRQVTVMWLRVYLALTGHREQHARGRWWSCRSRQINSFNGTRRQIHQCNREAYSSEDYVIIISWILSRTGATLDVPWINLLCSRHGVAACMRSHAWSWSYSTCTWFCQLNFLHKECGSDILAYMLWN